MEEQGASAVKEQGTAAAPGSISMMTLLVPMLAAVLLALGAAGGGFYWLLKSGKLGVAGGAAHPVEEAKVVRVPTKLVSLDPLLVNLADAGGKAYLRVAITLKVDDPPPVKGAKAKEEKPEKGKPANENDAAMRDAALSVLGKQTGDALLEPDGKERLKHQLQEEFHARIPEVKVVDVLLTEFLVQR